MSLYPIVRPLLFSMDPERAHHLALRSLDQASRRPALLRLLARTYHVEAPELAVRVFGHELPNCIGLGAGFDKNGAVLPVLGALGFGHIEVGTVVPRSQPGNSGTRLWRMPTDLALVNWLGFNSEGADAAARHLAAYRSRAGHGGPMIGVNLGKNSATPVERSLDDYLYVFRELFDYGDYFVVNVSCPNTPGGLNLQGSHLLDEILYALLEEAALRARARGRAVPPFLLKISPDLSEAELDAVVEVVLARGLSGIVATNTTIRRELTLRDGRPDRGGISGRPLTALSTQVVAGVRRRVGSRIPIVGVGGVFTGADAYDKILAGASLVQIHSGMVFRGPGIVRDARRELVARLRAEGFASVTEAVGRSVDGLGAPRSVAPPPTPDAARVV